MRRVPQTSDGIREEDKFGRICHLFFLNVTAHDSSSTAAAADDSLECQNNTTDRQLLCHRKWNERRKDKTVSSRIPFFFVLLPFKMLDNVRWLEPKQSHTRRYDVTISIPCCSAAAAFIGSHPQVPTRVYSRVLCISICTEVCGCIPRSLSLLFNRNLFIYVIQHVI